MKGNLEPGRQTLRNFCNENTDKKKDSGFQFFSLIKMGWMDGKCELIEDGLNSPCARLIDWENGLIMKLYDDRHTNGFSSWDMRNRNQLVLAEQVNSHDFFYTVKMLIKENYCSVNQKRGWGFQHVQSAYVVLLKFLGVSFIMPSKIP